MSAITGIITDITDFIKIENLIIIRKNNPNR